MQYELSVFLSPNYHFLLCFSVLNLKLTGCLIKKWTELLSCRNSSWGEIYQHRICFSTQGWIPILNPKCYFWYCQRKCGSQGSWIESSYKVILKACVRSQQSYECTFMQVMGAEWLLLWVALEIFQIQRWLWFWSVSGTSTGYLW